MSLNIHTEIAEKLNNYIDMNKIPNLLFHGASGSGKKTILNDFLRKIYNDDGDIMKHFIMSVNCAQGKGIKFIREDLKFFAKTNINIQNGKRFKSVVLLNADKLTIDAQSALRRCIELFSHSTRFFLVVSDKYKILKPILSRFCEIFIPEPTINGKIINLHTYQIKDCFSEIDTTKQKRIKLKGEMSKLIGNIKENDTSIKNVEINIIFDTTVRLYEMGFNAIDVIECIKTDKTISLIKKCEYVMFFDKIRKEFRNEKLLISNLLYFYLIRSDYTLENISFM